MSDPIGELRGALERLDHDPHRGQRGRMWFLDGLLWEIVREAHAARPGWCAEVLGPFLDGAASSSPLDPFLVLTDLDDLELACRLMPRAPLGLQIIDQSGKLSGVRGGVILSTRPELARLSHLHLHLHMNLGRRGAAALAQNPGLGRATTTRLPHNGLRTSGLKPLVEAGAFRSTRALDLSSNNLGATALRLLQDPDAAPEVVDLDLSENTLSFDRIRDLARSGAFARPEVLRLRRCQIDGQGLRTLWGKPLMSTVRALDLSGNRLEAAPLDTHVDAPRLERLSMDMAGVTDGALEGLARNPGLTSLRALSLSMCHVGAPGLQALGEGALARGLLELDLSYCRLIDDAIEALFAADAFAHLEVLDLRGRRLGDRTCAVLARADLSGLRRLELDGNPIGDEAAAIFTNPTLTNLERFTFGAARTRPGRRTLEAILDARHMTRLEYVGAFADDGDTRTLDVVRALTDRGVRLSLDRRR